MGQYSKEVKEVLGEDVWENIMESVNRGVIDEDKMQEIARSLTDKVGGNQTRRKKCDAHAMSEILSDWYNDELLDMDTETALTRLRAICLKPTLKLNILARFLKEKLSKFSSNKDNTPPPSTAGASSLAAKMKTLLVLGKTGSGKSTLCNRLAGENHNSETFPVDSGAKSCTQENVVKNVHFGGDKDRKVRLIDTVGYDDPDKDQEVVQDLVNKIKETCTFGIALNGQSRRLDKSLIQMLEIFQSNFGGAFWKNCIFIFTHIPMDNAQIKKRRQRYNKTDDETAEEFVKEVNHRFSDSLGVRSLIVDATYDQENQEENACFKAAVEDLYKNIENAKDYRLPTLAANQRSYGFCELPLSLRVKEEARDVGSGVQEVPSFQTGDRKRKGAKHKANTLKMKRSTSDLDELEFLNSRNRIVTFHEDILAHPYSERLTLSAWAAEIQKETILPPTPVTYHRKYQTKESFLKDSFKGEALPGVFRPSDSGLSEKEAIDMFSTQTGEPPASLVVLNDWIFEKYLPPLPKFHEKHHSVDMQGFDRKFYAQMRPLTFSQREPQEEGEDKKPHRVWDQEEVDRYVRGNSKDLQPLEDFIADASLTTIGPSEDKLKDYVGFCVKHPTRCGLLVAKVLFDYNALSFKCITSNTKAGICAICNGLLVLPHHVVALCYWWPEGLQDSQVIGIATVYF